ncbi:ECF transporter S component [Helcobacillus massiliensis]|uniref:Energy-coupling factor transport system substrate-specific component n=1 Tax=Helcobacillus massiliensis TaxID=521392 RepID=A0A839QVC0_9MICO|nr:ECF transporter S component [Helcobacillus massiliensis]MBB3022730.1 energy-coupling factor transport system substrate-specific component [Helcobacillus massiliensis]MDK7742934.1 ECF transporter S component [Helcobacillus massiliensis]WOO92073.1 ECF transporter S component [Helcobacillus massiliensis]
MTTTPTAPERGWRTIDILVTVLIGVAFGVAFMGYSLFYTAIGPVTALFRPAEGILTGIWCLPAILALLIVRKPGAALGAEMIAAILEALLGSHFGIGAVISGAAQGLGMEIGFAVFGYRRFGWAPAALGACLSVFFEWIYEIIAYFPEWDVFFKGMYLVFFLISGLVLTAGLGLLLTRLLASTGAINRFAPGREHAERTAV